MAFQKFTKLISVDQIKGSLRLSEPILVTLKGITYLIVGFDDDIQAFQTQGWSPRLIPYVELQEALDLGVLEIFGKRGD